MGIVVFSVIYQAKMTRQNIISHKLQSESPPCSPFSCRHCADLGGAGKPGSQGSSEGLHSGTGAGREVPAASSRNQGRGGGFRWSIPNAWPTWAVDTDGFGTDDCNKHYANFGGVLFVCVYLLKVRFIMISQQVGLSLEQFCLNELDCHQVIRCCHTVPWLFSGWVWFGFPL